MKLTEAEQRELNLLQSYVKSVFPMSPEQHKRQEILIKKACHNNCLNPQCKGFEGTDLQQICPLCGTALYKNPEHEK